MLNRKRNFAIAVWGILILAAALRLWGVGTKALWLDEIMTVQKAQMPFSEMISQIKQHDAHPPLFQMAEWLWMRLGEGDGFVRLPAVAFGVIGVWFTILVARRLFGPRAAVAAGAVMALSGYHVYYSQEARLYSLVTALVLAQTLVVLRILAKRGKAGWRWWAAFALLGLASLYTYSLCILTIAALALAYLVLARKRRLQFWPWVAAHLFMGAVFLPWALVLRRTTSALVESMARLGDAAPPPNLREVFSGIASWVLGVMHWDASILEPALGVVFVSAAVLVLILRRNRKSLVLFTCLFFLPLIAYLLLPFPRIYVYDPKNLIFLQPILLIALTGLRRTRPSGRIPAIAYLAAALIFWNALSLRVYYDPGFQKERWPEVVNDIQPQLANRDAIVFNPSYGGFAFSYYLPTPEDRDMVRNHAVAVYDMSRVLANRVWLIEARSAVENPTPAAPLYLGRVGFKAAAHKEYPGALGELSWVRYDKPSRDSVPVAP